MFYIFGIQTAEVLTCILFSLFGFSPPSIQYTWSFHSIKLVLLQGRNAFHIYKYCTVLDLISVVVIVTWFLFLLPICWFSVPRQSLVECHCVCVRVRAVQNSFVCVPSLWISRRICSKVLVYKILYLEVRSLTWRHFEQWIYGRNLWTEETGHQTFHWTWGASKGKSEHTLLFGFSKTYIEDASACGTQYFITTIKRLVSI